MVKATVILPTYNRSRLLDKAIQSVLNQSFRSWELIIVDDGSSDNTLDICRKYSVRESRIQYHRQTNQGVARARNQGLRHANGQYIAFLDDDDEYFPDALERLVKTLEADDRLAFVYGQANVIDDKGDLLYVSPRTAVTNFDELISRSVILPSSALIRRSAWGGKFALRTDLRTCDDYDLFLRLASRHPFKHLPKPVALYRRHTAVSLTKNRLKIYSDEIKVRMDWLRMLRNATQLEKVKGSIFQSLQSIQCLAKDHYKMGEFDAAQTCFLSFLKMDPFGLLTGQGKPAYLLVLKAYVGFLCALSMVVIQKITAHHHELAQSRVQK